MATDRQPPAAGHRRGRLYRRAVGCRPRRSCRASSASTGTRCAARWRLSRSGLVRVEQGRGSFVAEDVLEYTVESRTRFTVDQAPQHGTIRTRIAAAGDRGRFAYCQRPWGFAPAAASCCWNGWALPMTVRWACRSHDFPTARLRGVLDALRANARDHRGVAGGRSRGLSAADTASPRGCRARRRRSCWACHATGRCWSPRTSMSIRPARWWNSIGRAIRRHACRSSLNRKSESDGPAGSREGRYCFTRMASRQWT